MNYATSSGLLSASAQVSSNPGAIAGLVALTDGTNAATVAVYDGTDTSGLLLLELIVPGASSSSAISLNFPVVANKGLYVSISGTGAKAVAHYLVS